MSFAGANENNVPILVESFANLVSMLDEHLRGRPYLFGGRPAFGDFGLWGQLHQAFIDPTCGAHLKQRGPAVVAWIERMLDPKSEGEFESLNALDATLRPLFARQRRPEWGHRSAGASQPEPGQRDDERNAYGVAGKSRSGSLDEWILNAPQEFTLLREFFRRRARQSRQTPSRLA
jgi:hypothetical protein